MNIPLDVLKLIDSYLVKPIIKFLELISHSNKIDWEKKILSQNPNIHLTLVGTNEQCSSVIRQTLVGTETSRLCLDVLPLDVLKIVASYLVKPKMKLLDWISLDKINWEFLSKNPNAIHLLEKNMDKIDWDLLLMNPNAIHLLEQNIDKIDWDRLSANPNAIHLLEQNMNKIYWWYLLQNPNAICLLEQNTNKIDWTWLSLNPNIFEIDKNQLKLDITEQAKLIDKIIYQ